jgi:hypothetical protein
MSIITGTGPADAGNALQRFWRWGNRNNIKRDQEEANRAAVIRGRIQDEITAQRHTMPDFTQIISRPVVPDYGPIRTSTANSFDEYGRTVRAGYGQAASGIRTGYADAANILGQGFQDHYSGINNAYDSRRDGIAKMRSELGGMFNFGEDPYARALLNFTKGDIDARVGAAQTGTRAVFNDAVKYVEGQASSIDPAADARDVQSMYAAAAATIAANNAAAGQGITSAGGQDVVGVGPVSGDAADIQQGTATSGAISAAAARANAQLSQDALNFLAASTTRSGAARQGEVFNTGVAAQSEAQRRFMEQEQARIAQEREQYRQAEMELRNRELMLDSDRLEQLAGLGLRKAEAMSGMGLDRAKSLGQLGLDRATTVGGIGLSRGQTLADLDRSGIDARTAAQNEWLDGVNVLKADWQVKDQERQQLNTTVRRAFDLAAADGKGEFAKAALDMLNSPDRSYIEVLHGQGIFDKKSAEAYWDRRYKNAGRS